MESAVRAVRIDLDKLDVEHLATKARAEAVTIGYGWLSETMFEASDPERLEDIAEHFLLAARDLRIARVNATEQAVTLEPMGDPYEGAA